MNREQELEAENAELRDMLVAAYRDLQRHGAGSVSLNICKPPITADMPDRVQRELVRATRQYRHNSDNSADVFSPEQGFVYAYDPAIIDPLIYCITATNTLDPKEYTPVHNSVLRFLQGTAPYNGLWYHEAAERARGAFWWRKYLPMTEE